MTLGRRLTLKITSLVAGIVLVSGISLWGLMGLGQYYDEAVDEYEQLRQIYEIGYYSASARMLLSQPDADKAAVLDQIRTAIRKTQTPPSRRPSDQVADRKEIANTVETMRKDLLGVLHQMEAHAPPLEQDASSQTEVYEINYVLNRVASLAHQTKMRIIANREAAATRYQTTVIVIAILAVVTVLGAVLIGISQHRNVMRPLKRLNQGIARIANANFTEQLKMNGDREFVELADEFNRMAAELDSLYRHLEQKVAVKSKELVRSERLASVGYLAAGIAHELSNPLGVISGYAEAQLQENLGANGRTTSGRQREVLEVICEETFRCKEIIQRLLSLTVSQKQQRQEVSLVAISKEVAAMVGGLKQFRGRKIILQFDESDQLAVFANHSEIKQVVLNLTINALEAIEPGIGKVWLEGLRRNGIVELCVRDNGRGLTPDGLNCVFEPFYKDNKVSHRRGMGLGLSITHAIIESHKGMISAYSEGVGRGSRFVVQLPAAHERIEV